MEDGPPLPLTNRLSPRQWLALDILFGSLLAVSSIGRTAIGHEQPTLGGAGWDGVRYPAIAAACVAVPFRRLRPMWSLAVATSAVVVLLAIGARGPTLLTVVLTIYMVASTSQPPASLAAAAAVIASVGIGALIATGGPQWGSLLSAPPIVLVGWLAGDNTRTRRAYIRGVAERATEREREREERSRRAITDERLRIARELHDVVAHTMSVVAVRSGVARVVLDSQPEEARQALQIIETTSRQALHEMRLLVDVLREGDASAETAPAPGLDRLSHLVDQISEAGVSVAVEVDGEPRPLPAGVDVSAFRIVQEALTNVVRHARPAHAQLALRYRPGGVEIEVTDDGGGRYPRPAPLVTAEVSGHGLVGIRERVALFGGTFASGPVGGGFRVFAQLPTDEPVG